MENRLATACDLWLGDGRGLRASLPYTPYRP